MRQLRVTQPWADLAYASEKDKLDDLMSRVQMLEARIRDLEMRLAAERTEHEAIPVGV